MTRRLIYADALTDDILKSAVMIDDRGIQTGYEIAIELIKRQPTVDAIPVEWILNNERMPKAGTGRKAIMDMIEDWRKENAAAD